MPSLLCLACKRLNPPEARFCYHDGVSLRGDDIREPVALESAPFPAPLVLPSGRSCRCFNELVLGCEEDWDGARQCLRKGYFEQFLSGLGRFDLATAARKTAEYPDSHSALHELLNEIPNTVRKPVELSVHPQSVNLGSLALGGSAGFTLEIANAGMGLLSASVSCEGTPWLTLGSGAVAPYKVFRCRDKVRLPVQVVGKALRAGIGPLRGRIMILSNGGRAAVTVEAVVPVVPFPQGLLAGARSPREFAKRALAAPMAAADLFARGAVATWYDVNGWTYPVRGTPADGLSAVQQFFEALGLIPPPRVRISPRALSFTGPVGATLEQTIQVTTEVNRALYAHATSSVPWLKVGKVVSEGRSLRIPVRVPEVPAAPGQRLNGQVRVTANGQQEFVVEAVLSVDGVVPPAATASPRLPRPAAPAPPPLPLLPAAVVAAPPSPGSRTPPPATMVMPASVPTAIIPRPPLGQRRGWRWLPWLPVAFLAVGLLAALGHDLAIMHRDKQAGEAAPPEEGGPTLALQFHDSETDVVLVIGGSLKPTQGGDDPGVAGKWEPSMRFGLTVRGQSKPKRLTFHPTGHTNNACVSLDGKEWLFGERPFRLAENRKSLGDWPGRWLQRDVKLEGGREGRKSAWTYDDQRVVVTQTVELIAGPQTGRKDTCLVRYRLENQDAAEHTVGIRFLLDTFIGDNDGVPFLIPGERTLCSTQHVFGRPEEVPDFIQACEFEDLQRPGVVALLQLRVGGGLEAPGRVTLGAWPNPDLSARDKRCLQEKTLWEVPVLPIHSLTPGDSAVTMYWEPRPLGPGKSREVGFSYGLGGVAGKEGGGKLAVTTGGDFTPGGEFTVTAYVLNPTPGQTVTLRLPDGFELRSGDGRQAVPPLPPDATSRKSPVTWKVHAPRREGAYSL